MPLLTIPLVSDGAFLDVGVGATPAFTTPATTPATWRALIDTGAQMTVISPPIVAALQPQRIGSVPFSGVGGGMLLLDSYLVRFRFGGHTRPGRWYSVEAVEIQPATTGVDVLIGMNLMLKIDMQWGGRQRQVLLSH
jgi:hypothetical protein